LAYSGWIIGTLSGVEVSEIRFDNIEWLKQYFVAVAESGTRLPSVEIMSDGTPFFLQETDGVFVEHIMFNGRWHKKVVDSNSNVTLEEV